MSDLIIKMIVIRVENPVSRQQWQMDDVIGMGGDQLEPQKMGRSESKKL